MPIRRRTAPFLPFLLLSACVTTAPADDDDGDDDSTADDRPALPDPGKAMDDWGSTLWDSENPCCGSPEEAYPVGTVTMDAGYIQGVIDENLRFFYVFRSAAGLSTFSFPLSFDEVHLHDGADLLFGDLVEPAETLEWSVRWDVEPGHVYAVEIGSSFTGFF